MNPDLNIKDLVRDDFIVCSSAFSSDQSVFQTFFMVL